MSNFSRSASWIRQLFTPSSTGWREPNLLSNDVSLNQPYDGGGYPLPDFADMVGSVGGATAALGTVTLFTVGPNEICRILCVGIELQAGVAPLVLFNVVGPNFAVPASPSAVSGAVGVDEGIELFTPIIPPGHSLQGQWSGGDAATKVGFRWIKVTAPLGTVFYV